ncbi:MAG: hypothetical protein GPJ52_00105 [Candidatus Heimdallarchaeota archaeon]|nr:hypothetical protein [Candidatus Heimdallarchaeota archaeon]
MVWNERGAPIHSEGIFRIASSENYIYTNIGSPIKIYSYEEKPFWRNIGLGFGVGIPILVLGSLLILKKRRS